MNMRFTALIRFAVLSFCLVVLAACTSGYINTEELGAPSNAEQVQAYYAGKSVRYAEEFGGPLNVEAFYGADGTYQAVLPDRSGFAFGTWSVHAASVGSDTLLIESKLDRAGRVCRLYSA